MLKHNYYVARYYAHSIILFNSFMRKLVQKKEYEKVGFYSQFNRGRKK